MLNKIKSFYRFISSKHQTIHLDYRVNMVPRWNNNSPNEVLLDIIKSQDSIYAELLHGFLNYKNTFDGIKLDADNTDRNLPGWNNGFFPGLDIIALYSLLAIKSPNKYIEIGSGNSTKVAALAKKNENLPTEIISIDPYPRAEIDQLADKIIREPFENLKYDEIYALEKNDVLFVDNSHRILPNSDAMVFFMEILPRLKPGVIVHVHDVYLPYDYPQFMCDRAYSEQYGLAAYLLANPEKYRPLMP
ncbi:MAG: class I SAM-dependent methyltransferase, partial [Bacteroidetes bacterium]|nr:class I SAM-dependent methyltransferase [Bacteroidota bacterium]